MTKLLTFCSILLVLTSCASFKSEPLNQENCADIDPYHRGLRDGQFGRLPNFKSIQAECAALGVELDSTAYFDGWSSGIRLHCGLDDHC